MENDTEITTFEALIACFEDLDDEKKQLYGKQLLLNYDHYKQLKILLITHSLDYSGAPIALLYYATMLKRQGYCPVFAAAKNDKLIDECEKKEIPVLIDDIINVDIQKYVGLFDAVITNTIVTAPIINQLSETDKPVLWWIHEADCVYKISELIQPMPQQLPSNVRVYTAGPYAYEKLLKYRPFYQAKELLYYIPKIEKNTRKYSPFYQAKKLLYCISKIEKKDTGKYTEDKKTKFALVGMQEYRKGHDILVEAIRLLDENLMLGCTFTFVGRQCDQAIYKKLQELQHDYPENIIILNHLDRDEMREWYEQIDCLICASRDDPMPVVIAEAMQHGKPIICSENTGSAAIVNEMKCGITYSNNNTAQLAEAIKYMIDNRKLMKVYGNHAVKAYKKYFTQEVFTANALQALNETIRALDDDKKN